MKRTRRSRPPVALGLWGRAVTRLEAGRRATAATVLGLTAAIGGSGRAITPLVDVEQAAGESGSLNVAYLPGADALTLGFAGFGILTWRGPAPQWAGILLALTGAALTFPADMLGAVEFGLAGVVYFRRGWPRKPYLTAGTR
jgi:hypothetical protein